MVFNMELLIQLVCWVLFGYIGYKVAENLNEKHSMDFNPRLWAVIGFIFGVFGLVGLGIYAWIKLHNHNK